MTILTSDTMATYKATIHSAMERGFKPLYKATCTMGPRAAAKAVVRKHFGHRAAETVRPVTDTAEIIALVGTYFDSARRKQVFEIWTFDPRAK